MAKSRTTPTFGGSNEYEKLLQEVEDINSMVYAKSRKKRAELIKKQLKDVRVICGSWTSEGRICIKDPHINEDGSTNGRCKAHGGTSVGPTSEEGRKKAMANLHPQARMVYGLYSRFTMSTEEMDFYIGMMNYYIETLQLDLGNILLLDRALRNFILNQRREIALNEDDSLEESQSYNDYDTKFLRYMQALGVDRKFNVSKDNKENAQQIDLSVLLAQAPTEEAEKVKLEGEARKQLGGVIEVDEEES